jgi:cobalt-zinc-cadmium efflux system outer membrane protein
MRNLARWLPTLKLSSARVRRSVGTVASVLLAGGALAAGQNPARAVKITLHQAIQLALRHNQSLKAAQMEIQKSQADQITASLRPNPVFTYDDLFVPIVPSQFNGPNLNNITEFDSGISYTFERGHKRQARMQAARDQTTVTRSLVNDDVRTLTYSVAQQFVSALLAKSNLRFAERDLASFQKTVKLSETQYRAGAISEGDLLKIKLQRLQFQTDVSQARLALAQALAGLRQLVGFESVPGHFAVVGHLAYQPVHGNREDFESLALKMRPDLLAAKQGVLAAESNYGLQKANGKRDITTTLYYTHVAAINSASFIFNMEIPIFDRNQGNIARAHFGVTQSREDEAAVEQSVLTDVTSAYEAAQTNGKIVRLYDSGYLRQAKDSLAISRYAYQRGAASLLDFLDAERSYRSTELAYRQALANYMLSLEQLREAVGTRTLP